MTDELVGYFGYGSLVNRATLRTSYAGLKKARLKGWRRHWQSRGIETVPGHPAPGGALPVNLALLSVHRHAQTEIDGMLVIDRADHLAQVDEREARYERIKISRDVIDLVEPGDEIPERLYLYVAEQRDISGESDILLQSYLDAVMAGFHEAHGESGVDRFFATTIGFDRHIHCDREKPLYPRAVKLDARLAHVFDERLKSAGVRFP